MNPVNFSVIKSEAISKHACLCLTYSNLVSMTPQLKVREVHFLQLC